MGGSQRVAPGLLQLGAMSTTTRPVRAHRPTRWAMVGALVLLAMGIIGMHGLGLHEARAAGHAGSSTPVTSPLAADSSHPAADSASMAASEDPPSRPVPDESGHHGSSVLEVCIAALVGLGLLLVLARAAARRSWLTAPLAALAARRAAFPARARAHDPPPSLAELSLLRC